MTLEQLQEEYGLTLTQDGNILILILEPPESVFFPLEQEDIPNCTEITKEEFEDLLFGGVLEDGTYDKDHQKNLLTAWKNR